MNVYPMTDFYHLKDYGGAATNPRAINVLYEAPYDWQDRTTFDIRHQTGAANYQDRYYLESTFMSQFIGTNNASLVFNENVSKFEWQYLHQPVYSEYKDAGDGKFVGADIIARIWAQNMDGVDNHDRHGGINIVNWTCPVVEFGGELNRRDVGFINPLIDKSDIGVNFMNKLGFNQYWQNTHSGRKVGGYPDTVQDDYFPLGTTQSDYDIAQAKPYTQISNMFTIRNTTQRNIVNTFSKYDSSGQEDTATPHPGGPTEFSKLDYGSDNSKNSLMGMIATSYGYDKVGKVDAQVPGSWYTDPTGDVADIDFSTAATTVKLVNASALQSYSFINTFQTPPSAQGKQGGMATPVVVAGTPYTVAMTDLNLDDVKHPYMEVEVSSSPMRAPELPKKTTIGYFLIMSDLIDRHEFLGSINNGSPLKCLGLLSKNYENNDFFFSFQSPVQFYVKQDRTVTSIKTEILTPSLTDPIGLDFNSSVIYTIIRENSVPEPDVAPVSLQQAYDYDIMEQLSGQLGIEGTNPQALMNSAGAGQGEAQMGGGGFAGLRKEIVQNTLNPSTNSPLQLEMSINSNLQRMNISQRAELIKSMTNTEVQGIIQNSPWNTLAGMTGIVNKATYTPGKVGAGARMLQNEIVGQPTDFSQPIKGGATKIDWDGDSKLEQLVNSGGASAQAIAVSEQVGKNSGEVKGVSTTPSTYEAFTGDVNTRGARDKNSTPSHDVMDYDPELVRKARAERFGKRPERADSEREKLAEQQSIAQKAAQPFHQVGLTEFYQEYRNTMGKSTQGQWDNAIKKGGVSIEDPNTWHGSTLRHWQGIHKDFNWGKLAHKRLKNKQLNLEGRTKINSAYDKKVERAKQGKASKADLSEANKVPTDAPKQVFTTHSGKRAVVYTRADRAREATAKGAPPKPTQTTDK